MNKIFMSGMIAGAPVLRMEKGDTAHLTLMISVRHRTQSGEMKKELYRVNAWNTMARWGADNLVKGQIVALQGYLTQRQVQAGGMSAIVTEITAEEFMPMRVIHAETEKEVDAEKSVANEEDRNRAA